MTALVEHRTAGDPTADDPLRGLYLPDEAVHHLLRTWPSGAGAPEAAEPPPASAVRSVPGTGWRDWPAGRG